MANHRILTAAVAAALTGSLLLNGWAMEVKAPATIPNVDLSVSGAQASLISMPDSLAMPVSVVGAPTPQALPEAAVPSGLSARAELGLAAAQINQTSANGSDANRQAQVSGQFFDANRLRGDDAPPSSNGLPRRVLFTVNSRVLYPGAIIGRDVRPADAREAMRKVLKESGGTILVVTKRDSEEGGNAQGHYPTGTLAFMKISEGEDVMHVDFVGVAEAKIDRETAVREALVSYPEVIRDPQAESLETDRILGFLRETTAPDQEKEQKIREFMSNPMLVANRMLQDMELSRHDHQELLSSLSVPKRLAAVREYFEELTAGMEPAAEPANAEQKAIDQRVNNTLLEGVKKDQRKAYLERKRDAIDKELEDLGEKADGDPALQEVEKKYAEKKDGMSAEAREAVERELRKANRMPPTSENYRVSIDYLEWLTDMPWGHVAKDAIDLKKARRILEEDNYGMANVKERILDILAVRKALAESGAAAPEEQAVILVLNGVKGVGKTSILKSVARALGRKFIRRSVGGLHDEALLRGHKRTYVGALPGFIIDEIRKAGEDNPVFALDEIDKVGSSNGEAGSKGNAANALLEALDPEQNKEFKDNYLDVKYDLSKVFFIGTANNIWDLSGPLVDRMEVIDVGSYTEAEKLVIAKRHLVRRQLARNGFKPGELSFSDDALRSIIRGHTREGGVRKLEENIRIVLQKIQRRRQEEDVKSPKIIDAALVAELLGPAKIVDESFKNGVGVAAGMFWSENGGGVLRIEAGRSPKGSGGEHFSVTGNLKEVMRESSQVAYKDVIDWAQTQGIDKAVFTTHYFDVHVPDGATPKDGPSAGISMATALASLASGRAVKQRLAMTGEISRHGFVLRIGGLREKALGALRQGYTDIIIPQGNVRDLHDFPGRRENIDDKTIQFTSEDGEKLTFHAVERIEEVLGLALEEAGAPMEPAADSSDHSDADGPRRS